MSFTIEQKHKKHSGSLYAVAFNTRLNLLFTGGADKVVASWDLEKKENTPLSVKTDSAILNLKFLNNEQHLFVGLFNGNFHIIDIDSRKEIKFFPYHKSGVFSSCYIAEHNLLFVGAGDGTVSVWDTNDFQLLKNYKIADGKIRAIQYFNKSVYIGNSEGMVYQIALEALDKAVLVFKHTSSIYSLAFHEQKNALLLGDKNAHLTALKLKPADASDQKIETLTELLTIAAHNWPIYSIEWTNENEFATCSRDKIVKIWDATTLEVKQRLCFPEHKGHLNSINNLLFIPESQRIISVGDDKQIIVWS